MRSRDQLAFSVGTVECCSGESEALVHGLCWNPDSCIGHSIDAAQSGAEGRPFPIDLIHQKAFSIKKPPWGGGRISSQGLVFFASGRQDSNLRHLAPKASALPNCATPRRSWRLAVSVQLFSEIDAATDCSLRSAEARSCDPVATEPPGAGGAPLQFLWQGIAEGP